jgi:ribonuclease HII
MNYHYEQQLHARGFKLIAGLDEVGRGPLAGPLLAAAVILDPAKIDLLFEIKESKSLTEKKREAFFELIKENSLAWAIGAAHADEIDRYGLSFANKIAMKRAWKYLPLTPDYILTDFVARLQFSTPFESVAKGDKNIISIAAASIIAKVLRDRMLRAFDKIYPDYGFAAHKGYGCQSHMDAIEKFGPCPIHRRSFAPLKTISF